jgi:hypothetical protein
LLDIALASFCLEVMEVFEGLSGGSRTEEASEFFSREIVLF